MFAEYRIMPKRKHRDEVIYDVQQLRFLIWRTIIIFENSEQAEEMLKKLRKWNV